MTQPRTLAASFSLSGSTAVLSLARNGTNASLVWLGASNLPIGMTGSLLSAPSIAYGIWQTGAPFPITTTATNWAIPVTASNLFYRLQLQ